MRRRNYSTSQGCKDTGFPTARVRVDSPQSKTVPGDKESGEATHARETATARPEVEGQPFAGNWRLLTSPRPPAPRHRLMLSTGCLGAGDRQAPHSPLITSATRGVPAPSRLMTPKHLEGGAEGRTGWPENNQPGREEAQQPHPRSLKKQKV